MSVHSFPPTRIYVQDTWFSDVPDTFALLPRIASDVYFSLEVLMEEGVLCLGGPNLNPETIQPHSLVKIGYNSTEIDAVQKDNCLSMFSIYYNITSDGITWNEGGISELFLQRKLARYGWEIQKGTIRLISIFMTIVRLPLEPACFFLHPNRLIIWAKSTNSGNVALITGCHPANHDLKSYVAWNGNVADCKHNYTDPFNFHEPYHHVLGKF